MHFSGTTINQDQMPNIIQTITLFETLSICEIVSNLLSKMSKSQIMLLDFCPVFMDNLPYIDGAIRESGHGAVS